MKLESDKLIHDIVDGFGDDKQWLNSALEALRTQVKNEVLSKTNNAIKVIKIMYK